MQDNDIKWHIILFFRFPNGVVTKKEFKLLAKNIGVRSKDVLCSWNLIKFKREKIGKHYRNEHQFTG